MINVQDTEQIKIKSQPKFEINVDRTKRKNLFSPPFSYAMYANSRGGKSYLMKSILLDPRYEILDNYILPENIFICSPIADDDDTYEDLFEYLDNSGKFDRKKQIVSDPSKIDQFIKGTIAENKKLKSQGIYRYLLFIVDDCYGEVPMDNRSVFSQVATKGRHHLASMFIMTQSHKGLGNSIRRNATHSSVWEFDNGDEINSVVSEMRGCMMPKDFKQLYLHAVRQKPNGFLFHCRLMPPQLKFSANLEEIIEI